MSILSSCIMGVHGLVYAGVGACMLLPAASNEWLRTHVLMFKPLRVVEHDEDAEAGRPEELAQNNLGYRVMGYLMILLGVCRLIASVHWGCGYVYLALITCAGEVGLVCNELLRYESMHLQRAVAVLLESMFVKILYIATALPYCR